MLPVDPLPISSLRPLRRAEYDRLVELGAFADEHIELLHGQLIQMSPQGTLHAYVIGQLTQILVPRLLGRALVRVQMPLAVSDISEPEPDVALVDPRPHLADHPQSAFLVVEVAGDSLRKDRTVKARLYAECGVPEYWLVDVEAGVVEVRRGPGARGYRRTTRHGHEETLRLLRFSDVEVVLAEVLPPVSEEGPAPAGPRRRAREARRARR
jgi:Uma2 family endonuclease